MLARLMLCFFAIFIAHANADNSPYTALFCSTSKPVWCHSENSNDLQNARKTAKDWCATESHTNCDFEVEIPNNCAAVAVNIDLVRFRVGRSLSIDGAQTNAL